MFLYVRVYSRLKGSPLTGKKKLSITANIVQNSCLCLRCVFQTNHLYSDAVFSPSLIVNLFFTQNNKRKYTSIEYSRCPRYSRFLRRHLQESPVLVSFAVQFGSHLRNWDYLRARVSDEGNLCPLGLVVRKSV